MAQWTNLQRIEKFENLARLYINCEKSRGLYLAEPGLTAGWLAGWLAGRRAGYLADEFGRGLRFSMLAADWNIRFSAFFSWGTALFQQLWCIANAFFRQILLQGCFMKGELLRSPMISYRSLLYNTTVLYDK